MAEHLDFNFDLQLVFASMNGRVSAAINRRLGRNLRAKDLPITPEQWTIMDVLWKGDGVSQKYLCEMTCKDKPSMTRLLDNLVRQKLAKRKINPKSRRSNLIYLTDIGKELESATSDVIDKTLKEVFSGISQEEMKNGQNTLRKVYDNIEED